MVDLVTTDDPNAALEALLAAATPGEYLVSFMPEVDDPEVGDYEHVRVDMKAEDTFPSEADAALIAAAPRELRRLLAENRALREGLAEAYRATAANEYCTVKAHAGAGGGTAG